MKFSTRMTKNNVVEATLPNGTQFTYVSGTPLTQQNIINVSGGGCLYSFYHPQTKAQFTTGLINKTPNPKYLQEGWVIMVAGYAPALVRDIFKRHPVGTVIMGVPVVENTITSTVEEEALAITIPMPTRALTALLDAGWDDARLLKLYELDDFDKAQQVVCKVHGIGSVLGAQVVRAMLDHVQSNAAMQHQYVQSPATQQDTLLTLDTLI